MGHRPSLERMEAAGVEAGALHLVRMSPGREWVCGTRVLGTPRAPSGQRYKNASLWILQRHLVRGAPCGGSPEAWRGPRGKSRGSVSFMGSLPLTPGREGAKQV